MSFLTVLDSYDTMKMVENFIRSPVRIERMEKELKDELRNIRKDLAEIKHLLREDFELSDRAKKALKKARETPEEQYLVLD